MSSPVRLSIVCIRSFALLRRLKFLVVEHKSSREDIDVGVL